jgi:DNA repair exonuclease SbcCD ATPase subunit
MADEQAATGQEPTAAPVQETTTPAQPAAQVAQPAAVDLEKMAAELAEARREAAKYRTNGKALEAELKKFQDAQRAADDAKLSEQEKMSKRLDELQAALNAAAAERAAAEARNRELALQAVVLEQAASAGIAANAIGAAYKLLDKDKIDVDDDGRPKDVAKALKALIEQYPFLRSTPATSPANPAKGAATEDRATREAALRARIYGTPGGMFDKDNALAHGGGVILTPSE